jgi:hypothetical protein
MLHKVVLACAILYADGADTACHGDACPNEDEVSLLQLPKKEMPAGVMQDTSTETSMQASDEDLDENLDEDLDEDSDEEPNEGDEHTLQIHSSEDLDGYNCKVAGTFSTVGGPMAEFHASHDMVMLHIEGLPKIVLHLTRPENGPEVEDTDMTLLEVGDSKATSEEESESDAMADAVRQLANSSFNLRYGKHLSSFLGQHGLDGGQAKCAQRLHLLLLSLHHQATSMSESKDQNDWGAYQFDAGCSYAGCDVAAKPGHGEGCPKTRSATWKCHWTGRRRFWGHKGHYYNVPNRKFRVHRNRSGPYQNVVCADETHSGCAGLCGKGCDCWESICSYDYQCQYLPVCCAHDMRCDSGKPWYQFWQCFAIKHGTPC